MHMDARSKSYVHGTGMEPLTGLTVGGVLEHTAHHWPEHDAVVVPHQAIRWSWGDLQREAKTLAAGLLANGLEPGDRIGILAPNVAEWVAVQFGTACAGLILVNINPAYRAAELEYALKKTGCRALITVPGFKTSDYLGMLGRIAPELKIAKPGRLAAARLPELTLVVTHGNETYSGCMRYADVQAAADAGSLGRVDGIAASLDSDDPINIQFTSGTTGSPKAATLTHHNIVNNAALSAGILKFTENDRL